MILTWHWKNLKKCEELNPYYKNIKQKIKDLEDLKKLKEKNKEIEKKPVDVFEENK